MTKADLARVSISLEDSLLETFDAFVDAKGYPTRSEAIRDLIREKLLTDDTADDAPRLGVLSLVFSLKGTDLIGRIMAKQREQPGLVLASTQVQLGDDLCLQVLICRGPATATRRFADGLLTLKGVLHGELRLTGDEADFHTLTHRRPRLPAASAN